MIDRHVNHERKLMKLTNSIVGEAAGVSKLYGVGKSFRPYLALNLRNIPVVQELWAVFNHVVLSSTLLKVSFVLVLKSNTTAKATAHHAESQLALHTIRYLELSVQLSAMSTREASIDLCGL